MWSSACVTNASKYQNLRLSFSLKQLHWGAIIIKLFLTIFSTCLWLFLLFTLLFNFLLFVCFLSYIEILTLVSAVEKWNYSFTTLLQQSWSTATQISLSFSPPFLQQYHHLHPPSPPDENQTTSKTLQNDTPHSIPPPIHALCHHMWQEQS